MSVKRFERDSVSRQHAVSSSTGFDGGIPAASEQQGAAALCMAERCLAI